MSLAWASVLSPEHSRGSCRTFLTREKGPAVAGPFLSFV
jgi:hypothetical protein